MRHFGGKTEGSSQRALGREGKGKRGHFTRSSASERYGDDVLESSRVEEMGQLCETGRGKGIRSDDLFGDRSIINTINEQKTSQKQQSASRPSTDTLCK